MKKRDVSLDMLRGFGIILMVAGHMGWDNFNIYVYSFHMPLFYALSGYLLKPDFKAGLLKMIGHRFKRLMIPYFLFGIINYFILLGFHRFDLPEAGELFLNLLFFPTKGVAIAGALWFLASLFCVDVLMRILCRVIKSDILMGIIVGILVIIGFVINHHQMQLIWGVEASLIGVLFYYLGYIFNKYCIFVKLFSGKIKWISWGIMALLFVPVQLLCYHNGLIGMFFGWYRNEFIFLIVACYQVMFWWLLVTYVIRQSRILIYAGTNTMIFIGFNQFFIIAFNKVGNYILSGVIDDKLIELLVLGMVFVALFIVSWITNKWKISRLWRS